MRVFTYVSRNFLNGFVKSYFKMSFKRIEILDKTKSINYKCIIILEACNKIASIAIKN